MKKSLIILSTLFLFSCSRVYVVIERGTITENDLKRKYISVTRIGIPSLTKDIYYSDTCKLSYRVGDTVYVKKNKGNFCVSKIYTKK